MAPPMIAAAMNIEIPVVSSPLSCAKSGASVQNGALVRPTTNEPTTATGDSA